MRMNRRRFLGALAGVVATGATGVAIAARPRETLATVLRVGAMSNLTHAPLLAGLGSGRIARALAPVQIETRVFRAGPRVTEALLGDAIDVGTAGPAAVVIHHARHVRNGRGGLRILGGCCSGGASLVVTRSSHIERAADLRTKRIAVTQIGTTQDIALRVYLRDAGLRDRTSGGEVTVLAIAASTILEQMKRGDLDGAWLPEPWATRVVDELDAVRLVDERELWPSQRFATAVLASRGADAMHPSIGTLARALEVEVARATVDFRTTLAEAHAELKRHVGNPGRLALFERAVAFVDFTTDPLRASVERFGEDARSFGLCGATPTSGLFG